MRKRKEQVRKSSKELMLTRTASLGPGEESPQSVFIITTTASEVQAARGLGGLEAGVRVLDFLCEPGFRESERITRSVATDESVNRNGHQMLAERGGLAGVREEEIARPYLRGPADSVPSEGSDPLT
ncbi:unnamed protein product [Boreogadus saida]